jgi:hypothetical protein
LEGKTFGHSSLQQLAGIPHFSLKEGHLQEGLKVFVGEFNFLLLAAEQKHSLDVIHISYSAQTLECGLALYGRRVVFSYVELLGGSVNHLLLIFELVQQSV